MKKQPEENVEKKTEVAKNNVSYTLPINGCLMTIILLALTVMAVKECKIHDMRYERKKFQHEQFMDSVKRAQTNTLYLSKQRTR